MKPPRTDVPPMPTECAVCHEPLPGGIPAGLVRQYQTRPGVPEWVFLWMCQDCVLDHARAMPDIARDVPR